MWIFFLFSIVLLIFIIRWNQRNTKQNDKKVCTLVVLGSGGHTAEMFSFLSTLERDHYSPRIYVMSASENGAYSSDNKASAFEANRADWSIHKIPRAREVGQSYFTSVFTTVYAFLHSIFLVWKIQPDVILCNGPGTCIPICFSGWLLRIFNVKKSKIVFAESFACVNHMSLSGRLLYPIADLFFVQWPQLVQLYPRSLYTGRINNSVDQQVRYILDNRTNDKKTVFVTVGSTCFDEMIEQIDSSLFINKLIKFGYSKLIIQYGKGTYVPRPNNDNKEFEVKSYKFKDTLQSDYKESSLIISHAGAGSILEGLSHRKPLIVIPNEKLMNNHQIQLAVELEKAGYLYFTRVMSIHDNIEQLLLNINLKDKLKVFPNEESPKFKFYLDRLLL